MRAELDDADINLIAERVAAHLFPLLKGKRREEDTIMDIDEAAELLKVSKGQLYQLVDKSKHGLGTFPFLKCGRSLRFSKNDILSWLKKNKNNG